jgi:ABC-type polysaccharide/polyol phosphate transport system ATPase subunit
LDELSVDIKHISKKFRLYHEKRTSIYESILGYFQRKKHYETFQTLDDVTFDVKRGEMFGIIGKNGSGKTTLLRILSHIYQPDSGSVDIKGTVIPLLALGLGFHPELTATANIIQSGILLGFSKKEISEKIDDVIKFAELEEFADVKIKNFSSGMQMRLAFSTAIQVNPDILILDEVFAVGDINFQKKCFDTIMDFKKRGKSIIFVSHDMNSIRNFCDRALFLNQGKIESIGKPDKVISEYISHLEHIPTEHIPTEDIPTEDTLPEKNELNETNIIDSPYWNSLVQVEEYMNTLATDNPKKHPIENIPNQFSSRLPFQNVLLIGTLDFKTSKDILELSIGNQIDVVDTNLENIKNLISQNEFLPITYFNHGYDSISKINKKYDAIFCGPILNYVKDISLFFKSLKNLLNDDGLIFIHDYVGPFKMIFSNEHVKLLNEINLKLPEKFRTSLPLENISDPNLQHMIKHVNPLEKTFLKYFDLEFSRNLNGGIAYPILFGNLKNFITFPDSAAHLTNLLKIDKTYSDDNKVPILFWYAVGKLKK